ncbi:hypothetical protein BJF78_05965 [Pseudonocardia sp. CNS-139]|nr:hypothetical protein BJF78_05965 [Pseudonocardia sp. CNS-139]
MRLAHGDERRGERPAVEGAAAVAAAVGADEQQRSCTGVPGSGSSGPGSTRSAGEPGRSSVACARGGAVSAR